MELDYADRNFLLNAGLRNHKLGVLYRKPIGNTKRNVLKHYPDRVKLKMRVTYE